MAEPKALSAVEKDIDDTISKAVYNPLKVDFTHKFDGEEITIKAGEKYICPQNVAVLIAKHLAMVIVKRVATEDRMKLIEQLEDKEEKRQAASKPYPLFSYRVGDVAKMLVIEHDDELPKASDILDEASEDSARSKGREDKEDNKQDTTGDLIGEDEEEEVDETKDEDEKVEEVDINSLSFAELRSFAKENNIALGNIKSKEEIKNKIVEELS